MHIYKLILNVILYLCNWQHVTPSSSTCLASQCIHYSSVYLLSTYCVLCPALSPGQTATDRATETLPLGSLQERQFTSDQHDGVKVGHCPRIGGPRWFSGRNDTQTHVLRMNRIYPGGEVVEREKEGKKQSWEGCSRWREQYK